MKKPVARNVSFGELFERHAEEISPSARKALEFYLEDAKEFIKGRREDGGIDWKSASKEEEQDLLKLDTLPDFNPLFVEMLFMMEAVMSSLFPHETVLYRDEAGEIRITDEGLERQRVFFLEGLEKAKRDIANPPESLQDKDMGSYILFLTYAPFEKAPVFHPRADSIFTEKQLETAREVDRLHQEFFEQYWQKIHADEKTSASPGGRPRSLVFDNWYSSWNLDGEIPPEEPESPLPSLPSAPTIRDSFNGVRFASSPFFVREGFRSICTPSFWKVSSTGQPYYKPPKEKRITYLIARKEAGIVQALPGEEAWRIVQTLGVKTGLLHIQFAAFCMESEEPWACFARADGDALIKLLRLNEEKKLDPETGKRRRLSRVEQLQELEGHLKSLRAIHVDVRGRPDRDGTIWKTDEPEPLWDVSILRRTQGMLEEIEGLDVAVDLNIHVRAGRWAMHESGKDTGLHYSYLSRSVLEFNPKTEDWAIKLGVFTSCFASYREHRFTVRTLLENLLNPEEITGMEDLSGDKRKRNDTANKLESTLAAMEERGWTVERSPEYVAAMGNGEGRRERNFFPRLLESRLELTPPPVSGQKSLPKEKKALGNGSAFSGRAFREQREKMGLSQKEAARELGRSQGMIALIEQGKRKLSPEDEKTWGKFRKRYYSKSRTTPD